MYDKPLTITHALLIDFGATVAESITGPVGAQGFIRHIGICNVTEVFADPTAVTVGLAADADEFATFTPSAIADGSSEAFADTDGPSGIYADRVVPADTEILIAAAAATTGIGTLHVVIDWNQSQPRPTGTPA
ncbi:MAG: hypothetical protein GY938_05005 [Ketobacter sp.]|nr:hypothetical protein [Ketobacter sp.]